MPLFIILGAFAIGALLLATRDQGLGQHVYRGWRFAVGHDMGEYTWVVYSGVTGLNPAMTSGQTSYANAAAALAGAVQWIKTQPVGPVS